MAGQPRFIGLERLEKALLDAFETWAEQDINDDHWDAQFRDMSKWYYNWQSDRKTIRANGSEVGSPRDIYDLGNLYQSGVQSFNLDRTSNGATANWHWDAKNDQGQEYAWYVHEGLGRNATPRRFTDDISVPSSFFLKAPGMALLRRTQAELNKLK